MEIILDTQDSATTEDSLGPHTQGRSGSAAYSSRSASDQTWSSSTEDFGEEPDSELLPSVFEKKPFLTVHKLVTVTLNFCFCL